ncbi:hypothetical protein, partial [Polynucleobacter asymbioticus]
LITGIGSTGIYLKGATLLGGLTNTGTIYGNTDAIAITHNSFIANSVVNTGSIIGASNGISLYENGQVAGGITNTGLIAGMNQIGLKLNDFSTI